MNGECPPNLEQLVAEEAESSALCYHGVVEWTDAGWELRPVSVVGSIWGWSLFFCDLPGDTQPGETQLLDALQGLGGPECTGLVNIRGGAADDGEQLGDLIQDHCDRSLLDGEFVLHFDQQGEVEGIQADGDSGPDAAAAFECIRSALGDLSFSCLANTSVCAEYLGAG